MGDLNNKLTDKFAMEVADEIVYKLNQIDENNVEFDFEINNGSMSAPSGSMKGNTTIFFDIDDDASNLYKLKKIIDNEEYIDEEYTDVISGFVQGVVNKLFDSHLDTIRKNVRRLVMKDSDECLFPLSDIKLKYIDIIDASELPLSVTHMIRVNKLPLDESDVVSTTTQVGPELIAEVEKTGKDLNDIIKSKKESGDLKYKYVLDAEWVKYLYEFYLIMDVDYSPISKDEYEEILKQRIKDET